MEFDFSVTCTELKQKWLLGAIGPRPIALVSTIDTAGYARLTQVSFFNVFSIDPPIFIFSQDLQTRDNWLENPEVVIHVVSYEQINQVNLCIHQHIEQVDQFVKAGFTKQKAQQVKPWMVKEIPIKFECRIIGMKTFGSVVGGGAETICIAEVLVMHIDQSVLDDQQMIDLVKLDPVARLGVDNFARISPSQLWKLPKQGNKAGIGFDTLPSNILASKVLTANHLGLLAMVEVLPEIAQDFKHIGLHYLLEQPISDKRTYEVHQMAADMLNHGKTLAAWQVLLREESVEEPEEGLIVIDRMD